MSRVGVLALQGGYAAHARMLGRLGHQAVAVRYGEQLQIDGDAGALDGLVLPGGESTTHLKLLARNGIGLALDRFVRSGRPVLATCAGLILAARQVIEPHQPSFGWLGVTVARNAWGRQLDSFEAAADDLGLPLVFIRAPRIIEIASEVEIMATYRGEPVMVRQGPIVGATFHPELTDDPTIHRQVFGQAEIAPSVVATAVG